MRTYYAVLAVLLCGVTNLEPAAMHAAPARLVADVYPGVDPQVTSGPQGFVRLGDLALFSAHDAAHGRELWRTDGTAEGTALVADIRVGRDSGVVPNYRAVAVLGAVALIAADDGEHGAELWRSDGTAGGTRMVADLNPGHAGSDPHSFIVVRSTMYFVARNEATGFELWRSDGTAAGTVPVADIDPGPADSNPQGVTSFRDLIVFAADDGVHGCDLWASDGTAAGTRLVKDTNPSSACYEPPQPGFPHLYDIYLGPRAFTEAGAVFYFTTDDALWKSDGSEAGTELLHRFGGCSGFEAYTCPPVCLSAIDGVLYFQADSTSIGHEPWRSDGTVDGTVLVADLRTQPCRFTRGDDCSSLACNFAASDDGVVFTARDAGASFDLWITDGTGQGTRKLGPAPPAPDPYPGAQPFPDPGVTLDGALVYGAGELYRHDGSVAGPQLLKDIMQLPANSNPDWFVRAGSSLLFFADDGAHGHELWRTNGADGGASMDGSPPRCRRCARAGDTATGDPAVRECRDRRRFPTRTRTES